MRGVNKVIIVGTLGQDPDTKYTGSGTAITNISLATNESWTDKQSGEKQERTEWHKVTFFGKLAEIAGEYLAKGRQVYIEGRLRTDKWTDDQGVERYTTKIMADEMQMLGGNPDGQQGAGNRRDGGYGGPNQRRGSQGHQGQGNRGGGNAPPQGSARERAQRATEGTQRMDNERGRSAPPVNEGFDDDDIPF